MLLLVVIFPPYRPRGNRAAEYGHGPIDGVLNQLCGGFTRVKERAHKNENQKDNGSVCHADEDVLEQITFFSC